MYNTANFNISYIAKIVLSFYISFIQGEKGYSKAKGNSKYVGFVGLGKPKDSLANYFVSCADNYLSIYILA